MISEFHQKIEAPFITFSIKKTSISFTDIIHGVKALQRFMRAGYPPEEEEGERQGTDTERAGDETLCATLVRTKVRTIEEIYKGVESSLGMMMNGRRVSLAVKETGKIDRKIQLGIKRFLDRAEGEQ